MFAKAISGYKLYAYCLMGNHVHLLLKTEKEELAHIFKRIGGSYVYWYNWKYQRSGHLFQDRFKSEPVENDGYFLAVLRYIHRNPVKAAMCEKPEDYLYSSYNEYLSGNRSLVDIDYGLGLLGREEFIKFNNEENDDKCLEYEIAIRLTDTEAKKIIERRTGCASIAEFQSLGVEERVTAIKRLKEEGLSIRQISRLTGVSKNIIERAGADRNR